ncbi:MAG: transposase [Pyrinomonadaceae bacterium]
MRKYDDEYKREAVKKIHDGQSVASLSRELGVSENQLHLWKKRTFEASTETDKELIKLKKELREVRMENEILKKAALIFGRGG